MGFEYLISVIMPTYNSEKTIERSIRSIRNQNINQKKIEIMIIDGGSTDSTLEIAKKYDVTIIQNEKRLPEIAKQIGLIQARGKYGIFLDSDEMFENMDSFSRRLDFFEKYPEVKNIVSTGMKFRKNEIGIIRYANFIGDPFSNFVYQFNGYNRKEDMERQYNYKKISGGNIYYFEDTDLLPLYDALGNMFELKSARILYQKQSYSKSFAANIFSNMVSKTRVAAMLENDFVYHEPGLTNKSYLIKLRWRIKNNLFQTDVGGIGFSARIDTNGKLKQRRYAYILYCIVIVPVLIDSFKMAFKNKDIYFLFHIFYSEYVFLMIGWYMMMKVFRIPIKMDKSYGKK